MTSEKAGEALDSVWNINVTPLVNEEVLFTLVPLRGVEANWPKLNPARDTGMGWAVAAFEKTNPICLLHVVPVPALKQERILFSGLAG
jgi:hypothetical protein